MASGHVNRTNRPNTWLHRPSLLREDSSCQLGAVHTWHKADMVTALSDVRFWGQSGRGPEGLSYLRKFTTNAREPRGSIFD